MVGKGRGREEKGMEGDGRVVMEMFEDEGGVCLEGWKGMEGKGRGGEGRGWG